MVELTIEDSTIIEREVEAARVLVSREATGFTLRIQSAPIKGFFEALSGGRTEGTLWNFPLFTVPLERCPQVYGVEFGDRRAATLLLSNGKLNGNIFRIASLHEEVTIVEPWGQTGPPDNGYANSVAVAVKAAVEAIYRRFLAPYQRRIVITSRETLIGS